MRLQIGEAANCPDYGEGVVVGILEKEIAGDSISFYSIQINNSTKTIMVPTKYSQSLKLINKKRRSKKNLPHIKKADLDTMTPTNQPF